MADAAVSVLVKEVVGRLTSIAIEEFALLRRLKDDILTLKGDFELTQAVLQDAEEDQSKKKEEKKLRLKKLRSTFLKVENLLDEISTEALLQQLHKQRGLKYRVRAFLSSNHNQYMFRHRIAHKIQAIRSKLEVNASKKVAVKGEMPNKELTRSESILVPSCDKSDVDVGIEDEMPDRETSSLIHDSSSIFGREEEMETVTKNICNKDIEKHDDGEIRVYGIWGMGGVGKTTLAQLVYNHERVKKHFELKCWVYVSQKFQVKEIIKTIIESVDECKCELASLDLLQKSVQNKLRGKKFLIVLDDVWIENEEKKMWDQLSATLSCGAEGSLVVVTTRSESTSQMFAKVPELQHKLGCLSDKDSWSLFKKFAFAEGRKGDGISELEHIGREIVKKCEGLPLALKTLGSLMWSKSSRTDWQRVKDSNIWELQEKDILPALRLSYDNLLPDLKRCYAYCCLFPKGYEMEKDAVIQLWVVNGFISPRGGIDLYEIGEESFKCLVWRSFFQANKYSNSRFKMHDLMHDMAHHVMLNDCYIIEPTSEKPTIQEEVLHLSSSCPDEKFDFPPEELEKLTSLRSVFMFEKNNEDGISQIFNLAYLRVLYLLGSGFKSLPKTICRLKHLRYLNLSFSSIEVLPESIIYLQNLQVLLLHSCKMLCKLPRGMRYMRNLQALDINSCFSLMHLPSGIKELTKVRILSRFPVGRKSEVKMAALGEVNVLEEELEISGDEGSSEASIGELGDLENLEGELEITGLENVGGLGEAKSANLKFRTKLLVLKLSWSDIAKRERKPERFKYDEKVLEGLEPNPCLKELEINNYMGKNISPTWMTVLKNLVEIRFSGCKNCEHISSLGRLPKLRVINLSHMVSLKCFNDANTNTSTETEMFPCVEKLHVHKCPSLVSLPSCLPKLKVLRIYGCDALVSLQIQSCKDLNELEIGGCKHLSERYKEERAGVYWPEISQIPIISIYGEEDMIEDENEIHEIDEVDE